MENLTDYVPEDDSYWKGNPSDLYKAAQVCAEQGSYGSCEEYLERLCAIVKHDGRWMEQVGAVYHRIGNLKMAEECLRKAVQYDVWSADKRRRLGNVLLDIATKQREGDLWTLRDAEYYVTSSLSLKPDSAATYNVLGSVKQALGEYDEAAACYQKAIDLEPGESSWHVNLAWIPYKKRDYETSLKELTRVFEQFGDDKIQYYIGMCLYRLGRNEEAIDHLQKSLESYSNSTKVLAMIRAIQLGFEGGDDKF